MNWDWIFASTDSCSRELETHERFWKQRQVSLKALEGDGKGWGGVEKNTQVSSLPEQVNSCFCTSATLSPRSSAGEVHCVNRPTVGLCRSHWANQDR